ncbi:hypothetical protein N7490_008909 [Penicillium lividum]|nr:hypothetical protein N7490_008909 [Penicillium lividum]
MNSAIETIPGLAENIAALELSETQRKTAKVSAATQSKVMEDGIEGKQTDDLDMTDQAIEDNTKSEVKDENPLYSAVKDEIKDEIKIKVEEDRLDIFMAETL